MSIEQLHTQYGKDLTTKLVDGIQKFIKLTALQTDTKYNKWIMDEFDAFDKIEIVKNTIDTLTPIKTGCLMNKKTQYNYIDDLTKEVQAVIFNSNNKTQQLIEHKRYGVLYNLIIEPIINMLSTIEDNFKIVGIQLCNDVIDIISTCDFDIGDLEQAYMLNVLLQNSPKAEPRKYYDDMLLDVVIEIENGDRELDFS